MAFKHVPKEEAKDQAPALLVNTKWFGLNFADQV